MVLKDNGHIADGLTVIPRGANAPALCPSRHAASGKSLFGYFFFRKSDNEFYSLNFIPSKSH
jgi:hypothetical protein